MVFFDGEGIRDNVLRSKDEWDVFFVFVGGDIYYCIEEKSGIREVFVFRKGRYVVEAVLEVGERVV